MISHYEVRTIFMSENNFSYSYNFSFVRAENQYLEVKYQENNRKKRSLKKDYKKIILFE